MTTGVRPVASLTYTTAIVVIPPQETWAAIQAIRQQHDQKFRRWMPHITLNYPFRPLDDFPLLREPLAAAVARLPAFDVTLAEFKTFGQSPSDVPANGAERRREFPGAPDLEEPSGSGVSIQAHSWRGE